MIDRFGIFLVVFICMLVILITLLPLLLIGDLIVHGQILLASIVSGLLNAAIIIPIFVYFFLRVLTELNKTKEKLSYLVVRDELTGVYNRRYFEDRLNQAFAYARRHSSSFGVLLLDIDRFKLINDNYGHIVGDEVIKKVAHICNNMIRETDVFCRYGGEEFACLLLDIHSTDIELLSLRINKAIESADIYYEGQAIPVTISIGVAKLENCHARKEDVIVSADKALYQAKRAGRNRVIII